MSTTAKELSRTAQDTRAQKSRDSNPASSGDLVAKALENEGADTIFTRCGGHGAEVRAVAVDFARGLRPRSS